MVNEREILNVLWHVNKYGNNISKDNFGLGFLDFAKLLLFIKREGFIEGVEVLYADDTIYNLFIDDIGITLKGIEYLEKVSAEINKNILEILFENRFNKPITEAAIRKKLFIRLKNIEVGAYLDLLSDKGYAKIEKNRIPSSKSYNGSVHAASTQEKYRITDKGIQFVENDFTEKERANNAKTTYHINADIVNFGTIHNLNINYIEEIKNIIPEPDIREEIEKYFEEIKALTAEENINKGKLTSVFKKIGAKLAENGLEKLTDKIFDLGWIFTMSQIMQ